MKGIEDLSPKRLWHYFARISEIPRPSKFEEKIIAYVMDFAVNNNLAFEIDKTGNVLIRKEGSERKKNDSVVVLQSHLDMVPQKNNDKIHNFHKDPITPIIDGEWVRADKTTLGADNGIGVAAMLAVLEDKSLVHGPIEALFTIDEETGMTGAFNLGDDFVKGRIMLNLDTEEDGVICMGCAGGLDANINFHYLEDSVPENIEAFTIEVKGLLGGHSGIDINKERGNAIKILNRILWFATKNYGLRLSTFEGGSLRNAIPREAKALFTVDWGAVDNFKEFLLKEIELLKAEFAEKEPGLAVVLTGVDQPYTLMQESIQHNLLNALYACPNGVIRMSKSLPGEAETSTNLASIKMKDGIVSIQCLIRSSIDSAKQNVANMHDSVFNLAGADIYFDGGYPGWTPNSSSKTLNTLIDVFTELNGNEPEVEIVHAGLECGIIGDRYPGMDMVSFGPTITGAHSPDEKVNILAVNRFWDILVGVLGKIS